MPSRMFIMLSLKMLARSRWAGCAVYGDHMPARLGLLEDSCEGSSGALHPWRRCAATTQSHQQPVPDENAAIAERTPTGAYEHDSKLEPTSIPNDAFAFGTSN